MTNLHLSGSNVLVWGALGFLGQHLVEALLNEGARVSVMCRSRFQYDPPPWEDAVSWYELDGRDDARTLFAAISTAELIYDFAGASGAVASNLNPTHSLNANCTAHLAFLDACEMAGHRPHVVFPSSWLVYDLQDGEPVSETHAVGPRSLYAAHKLCIENYLRIYQFRGRLSYTVLRLSNPYGCDRSRPTRGYKVLNSFIQNSLAGESICLYGDGSQMRDFIYIADVIQAFLACGREEARNQVFNISSGVSHSMLEAVALIRDIAGRTAIMHKPWPPEYLAVEAGNYKADISKARTRIGFAPNVSLRQGLEQTVRDLRATRKLALDMRAGASG